LFYASFADQCKVIDGKVAFGPSVDPEHTDFGINNSPYDLAWARHTLRAAIQAATDLGVDAELVTRWTRTLGKLPDYPLAGTPGQEIIQVPGRDNAYNIVTPVVPLFPAEQASWFSPEKETALFKRTIQWMQDRYNRNNSVVMLNVARARLSMTDEAYADTRNWFKGKEQSNGLFFWQAHGFYMTEQTAVAGLINEFLLQSVENIIRIFPAWPKDKDASFTTLRARGGFLVTAEQKAGKIVKLEITSTVGGKLRFLDPWTGIIVEHETKPGQTIRPNP
jgi:alpha-L-fucosidase 2